LHDCADLAATDSVGIKHRGQTKLEIKSRGACYKEDVGGASEAYVKVKLGKGADVPAVMDYLRQTGSLTKELEHRLLQPIEVHTAKLVSVLACYLRLAQCKQSIVRETVAIRATVPLCTAFKHSESVYHESLQVGTQLIYCTAGSKRSTCWSS
jgi:hypothetical protein